MDAKFEQFAVEAFPRLLGLARVLARDEHDAADLVQDTLIKVGTRWSRVHDEGNPVGYAATVLTRINLDRLRKETREHRMRDLVRARSQRVSYEVDDEESEVPGWLAAAWGTLSPKQRAAIALRFLHDLDTRQIAQTIGCSEATVRAHVSRGLDRLRDGSDQAKRGIDHG